ncbi:MAG: hypothetical protein O3C21_07510 [Verrucomicrobia bacterium]|nr:hypothetical protein [Verrucomicrobiota bacterium]
MYFKVISSFVIAFWLITTGLLIQMIYFPEESKFSEVPPTQVLDLFVTSGLEQMDIFSGKDLVGKLSVVPSLKPDLRSADESVRSRDLPKVVSLKMAGDIDVEIGHLDGKVRLRSELWMERDGEVISYSIELSMKELGITCELSQNGGDDTIHYLVKNGDAVLLDSSSANSTIDQQLQAQLLMRAWGIDLAKIQEQAKAEASQKEGARLLARRGIITVSGARLNGYILDVKVLGDAGLKFFFSETGELLTMESFLDYRLVSYELRLDPDAEGLRDDGTGEVVVPVPEGAVIPVPDSSKEKP